MTQFRDATISERVYAFAIDHFVVMGIFLTLTISLVYNFLQLSGKHILYMIVIVVGLYSVVRDIPGGRSPGKNSLNMFIVNIYEEHKLPNKMQLIVRNIAIILLPLDVILFLISHNKRRIGDRLTKTKVVKVSTMTNFNGKYSNDYLDTRGYPFGLFKKK